MILVDTSIWVDHLRSGNATLAAMLETGTVLTHPFVVGEIALGHLRQRDTVLGALLHLPQAAMATDAEARYFIDHNQLFGRGIGYVDAHLLAAVQLTAGDLLWTADRRLQEVADQLGLAIKA